MYSLAIDTATQYCTVGIGSTYTLKSFRVTDSPNNHTDFLIPQIREVLNESHLSGAELSDICITIGPGSFTGLRIALSAAQGLAIGWGKQIKCLSTFEAYLHAAYPDQSFLERRAADQEILPAAPLSQAHLDALSHITGPLYGISLATGAHDYYLKMYAQEGGSVWGPFRLLKEEVDHIQKATQAAITYQPAEYHPQNVLKALLRYAYVQPLQILYPTQ